MSQVRTRPAPPPVIDAPVPCRACPIRALPAFRDAADAEVDFIQAHKSAHLRVPAGTAIVLEGSAAGRVLTLFAGWAFRHKSLADGRRQILNVLLPGDLIGLQANLDSAASHGIEALTDVELCAFARDTVWDAFRDHPRLAFDLTWLAARGERLVDEVLLSVGRRTATERVAMLLVHLFKRAAAAGLRVGDTVPFPLNQGHLADALGLSVVHVNRTLQKLRRQDLIRLGDGRLAIGDLRALRRVAQYWQAETETRPLL